jgi:hypothetical protein
MLEDGDELRTWALDSAGVIAGVEIAARELAPHRPVYLEYEGPVSGGRGVVRRLDAGTFVVKQWSSDLVQLRLSGRQLVGEVTLKRLGSEESSVVVPWTFRLGNLD